MTLLTTILGFIMILAGVFCFFNPVSTFLATGVIVGAMFLVYGVAGIIKGFQGRSHFIEIILSILSAVLGVFCFMKPGVQERLDKSLLIFISIWFILQGVVTLFISFRVKGLSWRWVLGLIAGVLSIALGIYSLAHPVVSLLAIGILVGLYCIETGFNMIALAATAEVIKRELRL